MGLPRGPGSSRHGRGLVTGAGAGKFSHQNISEMIHLSSAAKMKGGCAMCGGRRKSKRRYGRLRLVRLRGRGVTRVRSVTVTRPSGASKTRSWGYTRSLGAQQAV